MTPREFHAHEASHSRRRRDEWVREGWFVLPLLNIQIREGSRLELNDILPESMQAKKPEQEVPTESQLLADREYLKKLLLDRSMKEEGDQ